MSKTRRAAVSAATSRPPRLLLLLAVTWSVAAVTAFGTYRHRHLRHAGPIESRSTFDDAAHRYHRRARQGASLRAPTPAPRSTTADDETISAAAPAAPLSDADVQHMKAAAGLARLGQGNTFPNPAVGCVLVRRDRGDGGVLPDAVVGAGFHPRAGMPHAEVFALLEACGHVADGVASARAVMDARRGDGEAGAQQLRQQLLELLEVYKADGGASTLFGGRLDGANVTAYVTLEPCCHVGQTPPCALSLVAAGVDRVVVGYRDPNPRVDGGGIRVLKEAGIGVRVLRDSRARDGRDGAAGDEAAAAAEGAAGDEAVAAAECAALVKYFVQRISPREEPAGTAEEALTGKKRRALRSIAGRRKSAGTMPRIGWLGDTEDDPAGGDGAEQIPLGPRFLERVDGALWEHEIVSLRLKGAVQKKKAAKILGGRIAEALDAAVAQVIGHTVLLYRPAFPPVLDLEVVENDGGDASAE